MEFRHVRYFLAVAEELNFNRAAARLHIAQPPLSTQIKDLEKELGVKLFDRTTRGTTLTREGDIFLLESRQILDQVDKARRAVNQTAAGELGRLRIVGVPHAFAEMLPSVIPRFRREKPNIVLDLRQGGTQAGLDAVLAGTVDVAFVRQGEPADGLDLLPLTSGRFEVVVAGDHPVAGMGSIDITALTAEPFVMPSRSASPYYYHETVSILAAAGIAPRTVLEADSMQAQLGYVACGMGVALVPTSGKWIHSNNVAWVPLSQDVASIELAAVWSAGLVAPLLSHFLRIVREEALPQPHVAIA